MGKHAPGLRWNWHLGINKVVCAFSLNRLAKKNSSQPPSTCNEPPLQSNHPPITVTRASFLILFLEYLLVVLLSNVPVVHFSNIHLSVRETNAFMLRIDMVLHRLSGKLMKNATQFPSLHHRYLTIQVRMPRNISVSDVSQCPESVLESGAGLAR